jgi:hypothetical protein
MGKTLLWLSLGVTLGIAGSTVYLHLTHQVTVVATAPACPGQDAQTEKVLAQARGALDLSGTPHGRLLSLDR